MGAHPVNRRTLSIIPVTQVLSNTSERFKLLLNCCNLTPMDLIHLALNWWNEVGGDVSYRIDDHETTMNRYCDVICRTWRLPTEPSYSEVMLLSSSMDVIIGQFAVEIERVVEVTQVAMRLKSIHRMDPLGLLSENQMVVVLEETIDENQSRA